MKLIFLTASRLFAAAGLGLLAGSANAAEWQSLRGNNHVTHLSGMPSAPAERSYPRTVPARSMSRVQPGYVPTPTGRRSEEQIRRAPERAVESNRVPERNRATESGRNWERHGEANPVRELERARDSESIIRERRHWDLDEEHSNGFHWWRFHPGMLVEVLPFGYIPIYAGGTTYYYYDGVYYEPTLSGYVVVAPPLGAIVPVLPPGTEAIVTGDTVYYYAA